MSLKDQLSAARDLIILVAILLFASGWLTSYYYLQHFGISLNALDWAVYSFYLYSLVPLQYAAWAGWSNWVLPVVFTLVVVVTWLCWTFPTSRTVVWGFAFCAVFALLIPLSREAAADEAFCTRYGGGNRAIYMAIDEEKLRGNSDGRSNQEINALARAITENSATLIAETSDYYFVLVQPKIDDARTTGRYVRAPVFRVPSAAVRFARTTAPALPAPRSRGNIRGLCHD